MAGAATLENIIRPAGKVLEIITEPSALITRRDERRQARALAAMTLVFLPLMVFVTFVSLPLAISDLPNSTVATQPMFYIGLTIIAVCIASYGISRTRWFYLGGTLFVTALQIAVYLSAVTGDVDTAGRVELLSWLTMAILLGSFFLRLRAIILMCVLSITGILVFPFVQPHTSLGDLIGVLSYLLVFSVAILVIKRQRDITENERHRLLLDRQAELEHHVSLRTTELQAANQRLETLSRIRDEMISNVSHELRTPLTSIKMNHELIRLDPDNTLSYVTRLERETKRLQESIEQLLLVSRLDNGQMSFKPTPINLNELVAHLVEDRSALAQSKRLELMAEITPDLPLVFADRALIGQALSILLTNALTYTPPGGRVRIATALKQGETRTYAMFSVSDSGPGISTDERDLIFERFYRGRKAIKAAIPGTGVGLSIVRTIVAQHKGIVELASAVHGWNTVFQVWLPTAPQESPRIEESPREIDTPQNP